MRSALRAAAVLAASAQAQNYPSRPVKLAGIQPE
jgi:tripartite-type tricarboxylate transporter receptor subunit TctC